MNFAFAGTPQVGAWVLSDLVDRGRIPALVISQPDRPAGRGRRSTPPAVVQQALLRGLPVHQTANINDPATLSALQQSGATTLVVAAFGQLLRRQILDEFLCVNVHASLLPSYRGAAPIARALLDGRQETGVTIMRMAPGLDDGPWAEMIRLSLSPRDDAGSLSRKLALLGAQGTDQVLTGCAEGNVVWHEQQGEASYASKLGPEDRALDPAESVRTCHDRIRALSPDIGADALTARGLDLKVWRAWPWYDPAAETELPPAAEMSPGQTAVRRKRLFVACPDGWLEILSLQPSGKKFMTAEEFLRGYERRLGDRLLPPPTSSPPEGDSLADRPAGPSKER